MNKFYRYRVVFSTHDEGDYKQYRTQGLVCAASYQDALMEVFRNYDDIDEITLSEYYYESCLEMPAEMLDEEETVDCDTTWEEVKC